MPETDDEIVRGWDKARQAIHEEIAKWAPEAAPGRRVDGEVEPMRDAVLTGWVLGMVWYDPVLDGSVVQGMYRKGTPTHEALGILSVLQMRAEDEVDDA